MKQVLNPVMDLLHTFKHGKQIDYSYSWQKWENTHFGVGQAKRAEFFSYISRKACK